MCVCETEEVPLAGWAVGAKKEKGRRLRGAVDGFEVRCLHRRSRCLGVNPWIMRADGAAGRKVSAWGARHLIRRIRSFGATRRPGMTFLSGLSSATRVPGCFSGTYRGPRG